MAQTEIDDHTEPKYRDEEWLREKYLGEGLTQKEISDSVGVSRHTIMRWMDRHEIEPRGGTLPEDSKIRDEEWLREKYVDEELTTYEIGDLCGVSGGCVSNWMDKFGIQRRDFDPRGEGKKYTDEDWLRSEYIEKRRTVYDIADELGVSSTTILEWMERNGIERRGRSGRMIPADSPYTDEDWLREKYIEEGLTQRDLGDMCDCSGKTILNWLHEFGIETRTPEDWSCGRSNGNWVDHPGFYTGHGGYEVSYSYSNGSQDRFFIHVLSAVAWYGWDAVVGKETHHRIPIPWLNVESNLHPLSAQEHRIISGKYSSDGVPEGVVDDVLKKLG